MGMKQIIILLVLHHFAFQMSLCIKHFFFCCTETVWLTKIITDDHALDERFIVECKNVMYLFSFWRY